MFEYVSETENNLKFSQEQKIRIAEHIGELFRSWDDVRSKQKNIVDLLRPEIYLDERKKIHNDKDDDWKSDIHLNNVKDCLF